MMTVAEFLEGDEGWIRRHEYVGSSAHERADGTNGHGDVVMNVLAALRGRAGASGCRVCSSASMLRVRTGFDTRFYHPDAFVVRLQNGDDEVFEDHPVVVVEVLSPETRRIDMHEKLDAYFTISSLELCLLVEADRPEVTAWRRGDSGFVGEWYEGEEAVIPLPDPGNELTLLDVYMGCSLGSEDEGRAS